VVNGAIANSLATDRHWPRQDDQVVKTKPLMRSCLRILDQGLEPREAALRGTGRSRSQARLPGLLEDGLDDPLSITSTTAHFRSNARSGRFCASLVHALVESVALSFIR
jgi:hypothetical protein